MTVADLLLSLKDGPGGTEVREGESLVQETKSLTTIIPKITSNLVLLNHFNKQRE